MNWQPIETAPKDRRILLLYQEGEVRIGRWDDNRYASKPRPFWTYEGCYGVNGARASQPTHWLPLPGPDGCPESEAVGELVAACKAAREAIGTDPASPEAFHELAALHARLNAVIAKAEGETK